MEEKNSTINVKLPDFGILTQSRVARPGFAHAVHSHDHDSLLFVIGGQGQIEYKDDLFDLDTHSVAALKHDQPHRLIDRPRKQMTVFSIYFDIQKAELNKSVIGCLLDLDRPFSLPLYYAEQIRRNLRQMLYEQTAKPPGFKIALRQTLNLTVLLFYRAALAAGQRPPNLRPDSTARVQEVVDYVASHYYEPITLPAAARLAGLSQRQFSGVCRTLCGHSFVHYVNKIRTEKAKELLTTTDIPVTAIAFKVGYEDLSTFYRAFKKHQNSNPMSYRDYW